MNLAMLKRIADQYGFRVFHGCHLDDHSRVWRGAQVVVSRFVDGIGTEQIAHYRVRCGGYLEPHDGLAPDPEHIDLDHEVGYVVTRLHPSDWRLVGANDGLRWAQF